MAASIAVTTMLQRAGRGLLPHVCGSSLLVGGFGSSSCLCFGFLHRTAAAGTDAMASAVRDNVEGWRNNSGGQLGLQRIVVGCSSTAGTSRCSTTSEDGASDILGFTDSTAAASCEGKQREEFGPRLRFWCCFRSFGLWGNSASSLGGIFETDPKRELCGGRGKAPAHERGGVQ
jgi:hypothetical protein